MRQVKMKCFISAIMLLVVLMFTACTNVNRASDNNKIENPIAVIEPVAIADTEPIPEPAPEVTEEVEAAPVEDTPIIINIFYNVPLDNELQTFIINLCEKHNIDPAIILAMIEAESQYDIDAMGDRGNAYGLLQIQPRWHGERIKRLGCTNLLNPKQNVTVAVDYLVELIAYYDGNVEMAIVAYNAGQNGAYEGWFKHGVYSSNYSNKVLTISQRIAEEAYAE